ncbi:hypothetical protein BBJ29_009669 [Phytophthora kernoviae]|uniref:Bromo domain-containing protein n=1 Tax=Phytophthora kernoviae TaxID=325452 RepID=A0A3F2S4P7_9STRA|nr:hypothetical protein BBJ29_009669 [Phytophthora kernoviae]RLN69450.1 hypothetical protein BBP00_00000296 [Phytophthora kernoviae]
MDLSTIEEKLKDGAYIMDTEASVAGVKELNVERFANDIRLMWSNCKLFNDDGSELKESDGEIQIVSENVKPTDASFIKFKILSGWNDFVAVHRVSVEGSTSRR